MKHTVLLFLLMMCSAKAAAFTFCVTNSNELQTALNTAESNFDDDEIRLKTGNYPRLNSPFRFESNEPYGLTVSGGWIPTGSNPCGIQFGLPFDTTLDGSNNTEVIDILALSNATHINVQNLSIINGQSEFELTGLSISHHNHASGEVLVEQVYFNNNQGGYGCALGILGGNKLTVRNNVFYNNTTNNIASGIIYLGLTDMAKGVYFINNTLLDNHTTFQSNNIANASGLVVSVEPPAQMLLANNLFWNNQNSDFFFFDGLNYLYNNNYQSGGGIVTELANNISVPPLLAPAALDFTPTIESPLIDKGLISIPPNAPQDFLPDWDPGSGDFNDHGFLGGNYGRLVNGRIDIGALEAGPETPVFVNGFD
jgi:hypothetical protein